MTDSPEVAVIVGAYRRERFLLSAVRSVLDQELGRDQYELLVTKNFPNAEVDQFLSENGVPALLDDEPHIGPWLLRAARATRAPLLAFLDDDDEFEPNRLSHVLEVFRTHPDLGFYRNRVRVIDGSGAAVPPDRWRPIESDAAFDRSGPIYVPAERKAWLAKLLRLEPSAAFNSSTMVVRRELLDGAYATAFESSQLPDLALFLLGLVGPWGAYLDDQRLTRFRFYGENVTRRVEWLRHAGEAHRDLATFVRDHGHTELAAWLDATAEHYVRMFLGSTVTAKVAEGATPAEVVRSGADYLRYLGRHPAERAITLDVWSAVAYAAAYPVLPGLARRLEALRPTRRLGQR